jgi:predicted phage terminase large subunit-like protein
MPAALATADEIDLLRVLTANSLHDFTREFWATVESVAFIDSWHVGAICEHLQAVTTGEIKNLLINIPPGCSKSLLVAVFWPMWEWARDPSVRWYFGSYDARLSTRDSVRCRALLQSDQYRRLFPQVVLAEGSDQKTYFGTTEGGYRMASSVGSHITGEHPGRLVLDDPNDVTGAESEVERQSTNDWFDLALSTRGVTLDARRVIIAQRLHQNDLSGHVLAKGGYTHICLPMRYEPRRMATTPLGWNDPRTEEGELLAPDQFPEAAVAQMEQSLGPYGAAGQLQQRPAPREGGLFKRAWFDKRTPAAPYDCPRCMYVDLASSLAGDWTAIGQLAIDRNKQVYVERVERFRAEPHERDQRIVSFAAAARRRYGRYEPRIFIEQQGGPDATQYLIRKLVGYRVYADKPTKAKEVRAEPLAAAAAAGLLTVCASVSDGWDIETWLDEMTNFPNAAHDDMVDAVAGAFNQLVIKSPPPATGVMRVLSSRHPGLPSRSHQLRKPLSIVVCGRDELPGLHLDEPAILIAIGDPAPVGTGEVPPHALSNCLASVSLQFADFDPADHQATWNEPINGYGRPVADLLMEKQVHGKPLGRLLLRKFEKPYDVVVIADSGADDRRALSIAYALADVMRLNRAESISRLNAPESKPSKADVPPNKFVYETCRSGRYMILDLRHN